MQLLEDFYGSSDEFPKDLSYSIEGRNFGLSINAVMSSIFGDFLPLPPPLVAESKKRGGTKGILGMDKGFIEPVSFFGEAKKIH